jgi:hypothetical protein
MTVIDSCFSFQGRVGVEREIEVGDRGNLGGRWWGIQAGVETGGQLGLRVGEAQNLGVSLYHWTACLRCSRI